MGSTIEGRERAREISGERWTSDQKRQETERERSERARWKRERSEGGRVVTSREEPSQRREKRS
jgi:hypothetical protein